jgi:hypothetical protein
MNVGGDEKGSITLVHVLYCVYIILAHIFIVHVVDSSKKFVLFRSKNFRKKTYFFSL